MSPTALSVTVTNQVAGIFGDAGTTLRFHARTIAHIPAPRLMSKMVDAFVKEELSGYKRDYVHAIKATLDSAVS